ncbi:MAG: 4-hydroxyacetophenone monooxygenase, partial [Pseudonocardiales bacterium]|nr:4-hydroxyacetophenone monooxygenase [Pseudonocardiales bacterium]
VIWSAYAAQCIVRAIEAGKSTIEVKTDAYEEYNERLDEESKNLLIMKEEGAPEKNYYVNEFGRLQVNVPWYGPEYHRMCTEIDWDAIDIS